MPTPTSLPGAMGLPSDACRMVVRKEKSLAEVVKFIVSGIEVGQQVVALAGPPCLKELGRSLVDSGLKPAALLRSGRLVFLTAPDCFAQLVRPADILQRNTLRLNGSLLRWVSDWSWAYSNGTDNAKLMNYQRIVHNVVRNLTPLSVCTVHTETLERSSLLHLLADHRRAAKGGLPA